MGIYVSSNGTEKDTANLDTQYLINALAKSHREMMVAEDFDIFIKYSRNIEAIDEELLKRQCDIAAQKGWK